MKIKTSGLDLHFEFKQTFILHKKCTLIFVFFLSRDLGAFGRKRRSSGGVSAGMGSEAVVQEGNSPFAA